MIRDTLLTMCEAIHIEAQVEANNFYSKHGHCDIIENIHAVIEERSGKIKRLGI